MDGKGNDSLLKTSKVTEWTFNNGGYVALLFGGFLIAGCLSAYIIAIARGNVEPFLPLISDAAGSPPQNGLFGTLISIGGMIGVVFMLLRYMIVMEKNQEKSKLVTFLNKFSLFAGIVSMCAITVITGYPVNFYRNKDVWLYNVGIPHMIGGIVFFSFGIIYTTTQSFITLFQQTKNNKNNVILILRVLICIGCYVAFIYHIVTVPDHFGGLSRLYYVNTTEMAENNTTQQPFPTTFGSSLKLPIDTSGTYLASAITEWLLVFLFCFFFFTFFNEAQQYSLLIAVETHCPQVENILEGSPDAITSKSPGGEESRQSEVRTLFRRDSTCQTTDDDVVSTKPMTASFDKGKYTKRQISSFDMLSGDKLEKLIESHVKKNKREDKENGNVKTEINGYKKPEIIYENDHNSTNMKGDISADVSGAVPGTTDRGC